MYPASPGEDAYAYGQDTTSFQGSLEPFHLMARKVFTDPVAFGTLVLAAFTYMLWRTTRQAIDEAGQSLEIARDTAKAAARHADIAEAAMNAQHRPSMIVNLAAIGPVEVKDGQVSVQSQLTIFNTGSLPARNCQLMAEVMSISHKVWTVEFDAFQARCLEEAGRKRFSAFTYGPRQTVNDGRRLILEDRPLPEDDPDVPFNMVIMFCITFQGLASDRFFQFARGGPIAMIKNGAILRDGYVHKAMQFIDFSDGGVIR
jgi:hypothetical protein